MTVLRRIHWRFVLAELLCFVGIAVAVGHLSFWRWLLFVVCVAVFGTIQYVRGQRGY